jgi:hypothetical protein
MTATLVLIHGRGQESSAEVARDPARLAAYVDSRKRSWLGGLAKGLIAARLPVADPARAIYPFYGNVLAAAVESHRAAGGRRPTLEAVATGDDLAGAKARVLLDVAASLGFDPATELAYQGDAEAFRPGDLLNVPVLRAALQFVARKTGAPTMVIEGFLEDVAYYLEVKTIRDAVLTSVEADLTAALPGGGDVVVVAHSLGSVVGYDLLTRLDPAYRVRQLVTAGSPLGYPVVQRNLLGAAGANRPAVPDCVPRTAGAWLNAYDVADFVSLIHPLAGTFRQSADGQMRDERTHNPSGPHAIDDYLSDPDVAGPIGRALA